MSILQRDNASSSESVSHADVVAEQIAGDGAFLDLVGALEDAVDADFAQDALDWDFAGVAHATVDLEHAVGYAKDHLGAGDFGDRRVVARVLTLVGHPGGVERGPLDLLDLDRGVREHPLNRLVLSDRLTECLALASVVQPQLQ